MLILKNACFIHFPKTGGHWVRQALVAAGVPFEDYNDKGAHIGIAECPCNDKFRFSFVRHPVSFFKSYWQFKMTDGWDEDNWFDMDCKRRNLNFAGFIELASTQYAGGYGSTISYVLGSGSDEIEFIGRYENLADDLITALKLAGEDFDESKIRSIKPCNVSNKHKFPVAYTEDMKRKLINAERDMMRRFGYRDAPVSQFNDTIPSSSNEQDYMLQAGGALQLI